MTKRIRFKHILTAISIVIAVTIATAVYANNEMNTQFLNAEQGIGEPDGVGQIHQQQEAVQQFYEDTFQEEPSIIIPSASDEVIVKGSSIEIEDTFKENLLIIIPSASDAVNVSINVLKNLSLSVVDSQPKYTTNWPYGASVYAENPSENTTIWTATADY